MSVLHNSLQDRILHFSHFLGNMINCTSKSKSGEWMTSHVCENRYLSTTLNVKSTSYPQWFVRLQDVLLLEDSPLQCDDTLLYLILEYFTITAPPPPPNVLSLMSQLAWVSMSSCTAVINGIRQRIIMKLFWFSQKANSLMRTASLVKRTFCIFFIVLPQLQHQMFPAFA